LDSAPHPPCTANLDLPPQLAEERPMHWYYGDAAGLKGLLTAVLTLLLWAALTAAASIVVVWLRETHHRR
jgi:hypothetical protein